MIECSCNKMNHLWWKIDSGYLQTIMISIFTKFRIRLCEVRVIIPIHWSYLVPLYKWIKKWLKIINSDCILYNRGSGTVYSYMFKIQNTLGGFWLWAIDRTNSTIFLCQNKMVAIMVIVTVFYWTVISFNMCTAMIVVTLTRAY